MIEIVTGIMALAFAAIHLLIGLARFIDVVPRSQWLSAAGGAAASYIFLHVLPELASHQETIREAFGTGRAEMAVYCVSLLGLLTFYGLERMVRTPVEGDRPDAGSGRGVFWIHIGSFALYNALIGYLLVHREEEGLLPLATYFVAMALHFTSNDYGLRKDHSRAYDHTARFVLAAAVVAGWALGIATDVPEWVVGVLFAFLAGGVVLNVLKEELPEERQSRFVPFGLGALAYAALLLAE
ncbi:hypothetical protein [Chthonobacter rhizosphaerae]|uniref:hypothetical protein n=1 Tax=Chthonobacter rhizosphaerae TaxID=2735553 RepID=UPI001AEDDBD4|nr:hypothetical protein [Chthonobacter rhizosphaerae]